MREVGSEKVTCDPIPQTKHPIEIYVREKDISNEASTSHHHLK